VRQRDAQFDAVCLPDFNRRVAALLEMSEMTETIAAIVMKM
jgi:hypothetical protein